MDFDIYENLDITFHELVSKFFGALRDIPDSLR